MFGLIYKTTNKINGKIYIGQTKRSAEQRLKEHVWNKTILGKAILKYGKENFIIETIEECDNQEQLNEREIFWIAFYNCMAPNGYNLTRGGFGAFGYHHTAESKLKLSKSKKGHEVSQSTRKIISMARTGTKDSEETRAKKSKKLLGNQRRKDKPHTAEDRKKMSDAQKKIWAIRKSLQ